MPFLRIHEFDLADRGSVPEQEAVADDTKAGSEWFGVRFEERVAVQRTVDLSVVDRALTFGAVGFPVVHTTRPGDVQVAVPDTVPQREIQQFEPLADFDARFVECLDRREPVIDLGAEKGEEVDMLDQVPDIGSLLTSRAELVERGVVAAGVASGEAFRSHEAQDALVGEVRDLSVSPVFRKMVSAAWARSAALECSELLRQSELFHVHR